MTKGTQSDFARHIGKSRQYVSKIALQGKLVVDKAGKVDFEKSLSKIAEQADPANDPSETMPRSDGRTEKSVGMKAKEGITEPHTTGSTNQYQASRAVKENYTARLKKVEYEKAMGELVHKEGVVMASFKIGRVLRDKLSALPNKLAPRVTVETDQKKNFTILMEGIANVIEEIGRDLSEVRK